MHLHLSLYEGERNLFFNEDEADPAHPLSPTGRAFLAGVLAHAPELTAVTNQWVNSYKRLGDGFEAPGDVSWTRQTSAALVRVPSSHPDREASARIELRSPDSACNPYLCFALVLAAGLRGIERGYELQAEATQLDDARDHAPRGSQVLLPQDLREAVEKFERSELVRETLGERLCEWYVRNKRREWDEYRHTVTEFERRRYLRAL
jgi:glutamine synthetase